MSQQQPTAGKGLKQLDIENCAVCEKGVAHDNQLAFFRVSVDHMILNVGAIQQQAGLEMMLGGNAALAHAMGPQRDIALCANSSKGLVCQECWLMKPAGQIWEALGRKDNDDE